MAGKDMIMATHRELKQLHIVQKVIEGTVKQVVSTRKWGRF